MCKVGQQVLARTDTGKGAKSSFPSSPFSVPVSGSSLLPLCAPPLTPSAPWAPGWAQVNKEWQPGLRVLPGLLLLSVAAPLQHPSCIPSLPFMPPSIVLCIYFSCVLSVSLLNHQLHETTSHGEKTLSLLFSAGPPAFRTTPGVQLPFTECLKFK